MPPSPRNGLTLFRVANSSLLLVGGGTANGAPPIPTTASWDGHAWMAAAGQLPELNDSAMSNATGTSFLDSGIYLETSGTMYWYSSVDGWQLLSPGPAPAPAPGPRHYASFAYDPVHQAALLFGGEANVAPGTLYGDAWLLSATTVTSGPTEPTVQWTQVQQTSGAFWPPKLVGAGLAFDQAHGVFVAFGGRQSGATTYSEDATYTFDGAKWTDVSGAIRPGKRSFEAMAYDPVRTRIIVQGGDHDGSVRSDTWEWDGTTWTPLVDTNSPRLFRLWHQMAYSSQTNKMTIFGGVDQNIQLQDGTWELTEFGEACSDDSGCSGGTNCVDNVCCQKSTEVTTGSEQCPPGQVCNSPASPGACAGP
jgi:hypothetical protein